MIGDVRDLLRRIPFARTAWRALRPKTPGEKLDRRDEKLMALVLARVLDRESHCVDVGAHAGTVLAIMRRLAPDGSHYAFEPIPRLADGLRVRFPDVILKQVAVSDVASETDFHWFPGVPAFSGIVRRADVDARQPVEVIRVRTERLDALVPDFINVHVLKIDVEGAELQVLRGASRILSRDRPWVLFEHGSAAALYGTTTRDVHAEFERRGLCVWRPDQWLRGAPPLDEASFRDQVASGEWWNFLAGPRPACGA